MSAWGKKLAEWILTVAVILIVALVCVCLVLALAWGVKGLWTAVFG